MSLGKSIWKTGWRAALGAILLGWIFHSIFVKEGEQVATAQGISWDQLSRVEQWKFGWRNGRASLGKTLTSIPGGVLISSVVVMGVTIVLGVMRWRIVLGVQGLNLRTSRAVEISFVAHFFNSLLLGSTGGDLIKAYYAARETQHKKPEAVVTVFADRLIGLWAMLLFAVLMMIPNYSLLFAHEGLRAVAGLIVLMFLAATILVAIAFYGGVSRAWSGAREWLKRLPRGEWLNRSLESCRTFGRDRFFLAQTLFLSMLLNAVCVLQFWILSWGLHLNISPVVLFAVVPMIICISALPITPSGLGVRENLFVFMLADPAIDIDATPALSLSLLAYAGSLFWSLVGGLVYITFKERHHLVEVTDAGES